MSGVYLLFNITTTIIKYIFMIQNCHSSRGWFRTQTSGLRTQHTSSAHFHGSRGKSYLFITERCCKTVIAILKTESLKTFIIRDHPFSTYAKLSEKPTFLTLRVRIKG